jgi:hypothetical protein
MKSCFSYVLLFGGCDFHSVQFHTILHRDSFYHTEPSRGSARLTLLIIFFLLSTLSPPGRWLFQLLTCLSIGRQSFQPNRSSHQPCSFITIPHLRSGKDPRIAPCGPGPSLHLQNKILKYYSSIVLVW